MKIYNVIIEDRDTLETEVYSYDNPVNAWNHVVTEIQTMYGIDIPEHNDDSTEYHVIKNDRVYLYDKNVYYYVRETEVRQMGLTPR